MADETITFPPLSDDDRLLLSTERAAEIMGLNRSSIYVLMRKYEVGDPDGLWSIKVGRRRLVPRKAIEEFIEARREA